MLLGSKKLVRWGQLILHWPWFHEAMGVWSIENIRWARHQIPTSGCDVAGSIALTYLQVSLFLRCSSFQTRAKSLKEKSDQFESVQLISSSNNLIGGCIIKGQDVSEYSVLLEELIASESVLSPWIYPKLDGARQIYICGTFLVLLIDGFIMTTIHFCVSAPPPEEYCCKKVMSLPGTWKHKFTHITQNSLSLYKLLFC